MFTFFSTSLNGSYKKLAYDFSFNDLDGTKIKLADFKNNVLLVEFNNKGILSNKKIFNINDMNKVEFTKLLTHKNYQQDNHDLQVVRPALCIAAWFLFGNDR